MGDERRKIMKKKLVKFLSTTLALILLLGAGLGSVANAAPKKERVKFSGEQIFTGLYLGTGEFAEKLIEDTGRERAITKEQEIANKEISKKLIKQVKKNDPTYFKQLEKAVYKEDYLKIEKLLDKGGDLVLKSLDDLGMLETGSEEAEDAANAAWLFPAVAVAVTTVAVAGSVVAGAAYAVINGVVVKNAVEFWAPKPDEDSQLAVETFIADVVDVATN